MRSRPPESTNVTVLAIVGEASTRMLFPKVVAAERLLLASSLEEGIRFARKSTIDLAFVELQLGDGGGLALVHHLKALQPDIVVVALATPSGLAAGAQAVSLGGAGLLMLPLEGEDIRSAVAQVRTAKVERRQREQWQRIAETFGRTSDWVERLAALAATRDRGEALRGVTVILKEATFAKSVLLYVQSDHSAVDPTLNRVATEGQIAGPVTVSAGELNIFATSHGYEVLSLSAGDADVGVAIVEPTEGGRPALENEGALRLVTTLAGAILSVLAEQERLGEGGAIKDPASSAYSFAYYVDVAGREIEMARRYNRRFAVASVVFDPNTPAPPSVAPDAPAASMMQPFSGAMLADDLLAAARETAIVARVDEHEFNVLLPETDGLGAHAFRRRLFGRLALRLAPADVIVGAATFPHDGQDLSQLLRVARRRADASRSSIAREFARDHGTMPELFDRLYPIAQGLSAPNPPGGAQASERVTSLRALTLPLADAVTLATSVLQDALRGGATFVAVADHADLGLSAAVRGAVPKGRDNVKVHAADVTKGVGCESLEALAVIAEHGTYALMAMQSGATIRGLHTDDPLLVDLVAERIGRIAGIRVFG